MRKRSVFVLFLCLLMLSAMLAGCGAEEEKAPQDAVSAPAEQETGQTLQETEGQPYVAVSTPYGDLFFQKQWADHMLTEQTREGDSLEVAFSTQVNDVTYPLFCVTIGGGSGTPVGQLTDAEGTKRDVFIRADEIPDAPELSESEKNRMYAMQEEINFIIDNLK